MKFNEYCRACLSDSNAAPDCYAPAKNLRW
jgi:hypothetical protein